MEKIWEKNSLENSVVASDAFFSLWGDGRLFNFIWRKAVIQPGGSFKKGGDWEKRK
ncbi:MAG: hypothetical protein CM15mP16_00010 [Candidatus Pelagibacterales bacterium]|nr:MAG: hypothetical protein CM15mP16_00010 [Pelagibacterales bacterium]